MNLGLLSILTANLQTAMVPAGQTTECRLFQYFLFGSHFWNQKLHPSFTTVSGKCKGCEPIMVCWDASLKRQKHWKQSDVHFNLIIRKKGSHSVCNVPKTILWQSEIKVINNPFTCTMWFLGFLWIVVDAVLQWWAAAALEQGHDTTADRHLQLDVNRAGGWWDRME